MPALEKLVAGAAPRVGLTLLAGVVGAEAIGGLLHSDPAAVLGVGAMAAGWWLLRRPRRVAVPAAPRNLQAWRDRCTELHQQFRRLDTGDGADQRHEGRQGALQQVLTLAEPRSLRVAVAGSSLPERACGPALAEALGLSCGLTLLWGEPLPLAPGQWQWPGGLLACDVLLFHLPLPLTAADLRWLEALPEDLPLWLLLRQGGQGSQQTWREELGRQWPRSDGRRLLFWEGEPSALAADLQPMAQWLNRRSEALRQATPVRGLEGLHRSWQADLERLRRQQWRELLGRTQWLVAAGVVAAPLPSLDLLVLAVANGLMLREMAVLWCVPWSGDQLRQAALEMGRAALAFGVVEWSSQALTTAMRLHGATWLVGGAASALSAAYLTRVIGHAMADVMALNAGVSSPDLERIRREAPLLIARAADAEKLDWPTFLQQARLWLDGQPQLHGAS
jgi:hypothetical protein